MSRREQLAALGAALGSALALAACLDVPSGPEVECTDTSQCDTTHGEVCGDGVCYGNPPQGMFALVISPPASRKDLVPREISQPQINPDGWITDLSLDKPVMFSGRVEATCTPPTTCDRSALDATITITRPSSFRGGPGFKTIVASDAGAGLQAPSFEIALPRTTSADQPYIVTVIPSGRGDAPQPTPTAAELVPPMRVTLDAKDAAITRTFQLGGATLPTVDGSVLSYVGGGLSHYRVVAMGRWEAGATPTEVSTVSYTGADGKFHLTLAANVLGPVELVARPAANAPAAPALHMFDVPGNGSSSRVLVQPAMLGNPTVRQLAINGVDGSGKVAGVRGAQVTVTATLGTAGSNQTIATFVAEGATDETGRVPLSLLDGIGITGSYKLAVVPPASSPMGVVFDQSLDMASAGTLLLPTRVALRGAVLDADGVPLKDVSVTARPSLRFTWSFTDAPQAFVSAIPAATALTPSTGEFVLFVDPTVADLWGHYDLGFEPASKARAPTFTVSDVEIPREANQTTVSVPTVQLPDAAFVRGLVTDVAGTLVEGAEVKVYRLTSSLLLCDQVLNAPASCPIPANLQGRGDSDASGTVRLTLPR